ncbi:putative cytochrome mitochondrial precursor [Diaporthe ampelina]|uniref:Putative cytochrome mitochondrial n=1 Tax=Diaporthe ampelina TaxID=1214573 RepID=A0A0G2H4R6_9PEZI|nr:putative cytochrome mitochondrial precursor [Diaporthe ampelina]
MLSSVFTVAAVAVAGASAAREWLNEPDTGLEAVVSNISVGQLPPLDEMVGLPDFDWAARNYLPAKNYTYYRNGAAGEWSYRNNLEVFNRYRLRPRAMVDVTNIEASMNTTILGYEFANPFFISPAAKAQYAHPDAELNLMKAAGAGGIPYIVSSYSSLPLADIAAAALPNQTFFSQVYFTLNDTQNRALLKKSEASGAKAVVWAIDSPGSPDRQRAARYDVGSANTQFVKNTWEIYQTYRNWTTLPIVLKGIQNVADARAAVDHGVKAIILSNHGGRNLDGSPSSLEVALEIFNNDPEIFNEIEVLADGGIRYGTDALRLMALGVKAVGLGRPFMYSNVYGVDGVKKIISLMRNGIMNDAANLGLGDLKSINSSYVDWTPSPFWGF